MIVLVQNSTSEMRKHLSKYEKNQKRAGLRSGTGRTISRNLNRQALVSKTVPFRYLMGSLGKDFNPIFLSNEKTRIVGLISPRQDFPFF